MQFIAMLIMFFSFDDGLTSLKRACSLCFDNNIQNSIYNDFFDERSAYYNYDEDRIYFNLHDPYWLDPETNQKREFDIGWYSTSNKDHIALHEIGHCLLRRKIGVDKYKKLIGIKVRLDPVIIEKQVGKYACRDILEFYSEVYVGVRSGIKYAENIIKEYNDMELIKPKINSCLKYHGGKSYLAKHIIPLLSDCEIFVDATVGAGNIILNTDPSNSRSYIAIDKDEDIIRMWNSLKQWPEFIHNTLKQYSYTEKSFNLACDIVENHALGDSITWCSAYIVKNRMSRGGLGKTFAWSDRLRGGIPGDVNAWANFLKIHYSNIIDRIKNIDFYHGCMRDVLTQQWILSNPKAVVYIDPPYVKSSRTISNVYKHEMLTYDKDTPDPQNVLTHEGMWAMIKCSKCQFYVSGYDSDCYRDFGGKIIFRKDMANNSSQGKTKQRRVEMVWSLV